jgi:hypothetical protein
MDGWVVGLVDYASIAKWSRRYIANVLFNYDSGSIPDGSYFGFHGQMDTTLSFGLENPGSIPGGTFALADG